MILTQEILHDLRLFENAYLQRQNSLRAAQRSYTVLLLIIFSVVGMLSFIMWSSDEEAKDIPGYVESTGDTFDLMTKYLNMEYIVSCVSLYNLAMAAGTGATLLVVLVSISQIREPQRDLVRFNRGLLKFNMSFSRTRKTLVIPRIPSISGQGPVSGYRSGRGGAPRYNPSISAVNTSLRQTHTQPKRHMHKQAQTQVKSRKYNCAYSEKDTNGPSPLRRSPRKHLSPEVPRTPDICLSRGSSIGSNSTDSSYLDSEIVLHPPCNEEKFLRRSPRHNHSARIRKSTSITPVVPEETYTQAQSVKQKQTKGVTDGDTHLLRRKLSHDLDKERMKSPLKSDSPRYGLRSRSPRQPDSLRMTLRSAHSP
eukprot:CFRG8273T1